MSSFRFKGRIVGIKQNTKKGLLTFKRQNIYLPAFVFSEQSASTRGDKTVRKQYEKFFVHGEWNILQYKIYLLQFKFWLNEEKEQESKQFFWN